MIFGIADSRGIELALAGEVRALQVSLSYLNATLGEVDQKITFASHRPYLSEVECSRGTRRQ